MHVYLPSKIRPKHIQLAVLIIILLVVPFRSLLRIAFIQLARKARIESFDSASKNTKLKQELLTLSLKLKSFKNLRRENSRLSAALKLKTATKINIFPVDIISFDPSSWRRIITVTGGNINGIEKGMFVVDENGLLVGKIIESKENYSHLILINDPDFNLPVFVGDTAFGLLQGNIDGIKVFYVEEGERVKAKDAVWVKIPALKFPMNIGEVKSVKKDANSLFYNIEVKPFSRHPLLHKLFVVK